MNTITTTNQTFTIADTTISMVDGLYSLNDVHKASGNVEKHRPAFFVRNQEVTDLANEIMQCANLHSDQVIRKINGGHNRGTYACKEIVYRYAMWISPKFALLVIRAFDALVTRTDSTQRTVLVAACTKLSAGNMAISDVYKLVGGQFGYDNIVDIPTPLLPEAIAFTYEMILRLKPQDDNTIDEMVKQDVRQLVSNTFIFRAWFDSVKEPLCLLNPKITREVGSILAWAIPVAKNTNSRLNLGVDADRLMDIDWRDKYLTH